MGPTWTITKRELGAYFKSPVGYIVLSAFLGLSGFLFFFWNNFFLAGRASMASFFGSMPFLFLFFGPAISMRLLAEERGAGTIELLLTMPVRDSQVVIGKYLAALAMLVVGLIFSLPLALTIRALGPVDSGPVLAGYAGTVLLGGTYLAVGLFASAITKNQIVALIVGFAFCLGLTAVGELSSAAGPTLGPILEYASPQNHFSKIARGVIELRDLVYYLSAIGVLLLLSVQVLESRKWR